MNDNILNIKLKELVQINRLYLKNFRQFEKAAFLFNEGNTLIVGPNAVGKTTILEAIHMLIFGRSFRSSHVKETIREGEKESAIEAVFTKEGIEHTIGFYFGEDQKKVYVNKTPYKRASSLIGLILGSLLLPSDIHLISGDPYIRRHFLDELIAQLDPLYLHYHTHYSLSLKQRNILLKSRDFRMIDFFEEEMAKSASYISYARRDAVLRLDPLAKEQFSSFGEDDETFSIRYRASSSSSLSTEGFLELFKKNRSREASLGFTIAGPQKDDLEFFLSQKECKPFSSEGQKRSVAAALKLASWSYLKSSSLITPLLLVDDAGLSFDKKRKDRFFNSLQERGQVLITTAEENIPKTLSKIEILSLDHLHKYKGINPQC